MSNTTNESFEDVVRVEQCYEACCDGDASMAAILQAHNSEVAKSVVEVLEDLK